MVARPPAHYAAPDAHAAAVAYVDAHPEQAARWGRDAWIHSIAQHLTGSPSPGNVPWRARQRRRASVPIGQVIARVLAQLEPPAGARPQPICETFCWQQHRDDTLGDVA